MEEPDELHTQLKLFCNKKYTNMVLASRHLPVFHALQQSLLPRFWTTIINPKESLFLNLSWLVRKCNHLCLGFIDYGTIVQRNRTWRTCHAKCLVVGSPTPQETFVGCTRVWQN